MSPDKYARLFDQLRRLVKRKYRGTSTRVDFQKAFGRDRDCVIFAKRPVYDGRPDGEAINDVLRRCGLTPRVEPWKPLSRVAARAHLASAVGYSLLWRDYAQMPPAQADAVAAGALGLLPAARCYTNDVFPPPAPKPHMGPARIGFAPITGSLIDTGIVLVDDDHVALVWVREDD